LGFWRYLLTCWRLAFFLSYSMHCFFGCWLCWCRALVWPGFCQRSKARSCYL